MSRKSLTLPATALMFALGLLAGPAEASCANSEFFTSGYSYVVTPGCEQLDCGAANSSLTDDVAGNFWILGSGNPERFLGIDNGSLTAKDGWIYTYPGYASIINGSWRDSSQIDGCIDFAADPRRCMALHLSDIDPATGDGVFVLITDEPSEIGNYDLEQAGDVLLAPIPRPTITGSMRFEDGGLIFLQGPSMTDLMPGLYLDPACFQDWYGNPVELVLGYRVYHRSSVEGAPAPSERAVADWTPLTDVLPLGGDTMVTVDCSAGAADQWLAIGLAFDSGFDSLVVSGPSTRIACGPNFVDPEDIGAPPTRPRRSLPPWTSIKR